MGALPLAGGVVANYMLRKQVFNKFLPTTTMGWQSYAAEGVGAGLLAMVPRFGRQMFIGALSAMILRAISPYLGMGQMMAGTGDYLEDYYGEGMDGVNDYLQDYEQVGEGSEPVGSVDAGFDSLF